MWLNVLLHVCYYVSGRGVVGGALGRRGVSGGRVVGFTRFVHSTTDAPAACVGALTPRTFAFFVCLFLSARFRFSGELSPFVWEFFFNFPALSWEFPRSLVRCLRMTSLCGASPTTPAARWRLGVVLIVVVALIWSASSVLVQVIFSKEDFFKPFFLTYIANSLFAVLLPLRAARVLARRHARLPDDESVPFVTGIGDRRALRSALIVAPLWFSANFTYNASLGLTSITSSTVIASSSSAFTLLLSVWLLREPFAWLKLGGVALCMAGNTLTAASDSDGAGSSPVWGDMVGLLSALLYGLYTVAIRALAPADVALFFGLLGLTIAVGLAPVVLVLHLSGVEGLSSLTPTVAGLLVTKGLADNVLSDYLWARRTRGSARAFRAVRRAPHLVAFFAGGRTRCCSRRRRSRRWASR